MATLTGTRVKDTYKDLLQVSNSNSGIDSTLRTVSDGEATDSILELSSAAVNITGAGTLQYAGTAITSTAAELNILDGVNATAAEINYNCDVLTEAVTGANTIANTETGTRFVLNSGTAFKSTLPSPASGLEFWFYCGATPPSGGDHTIVTPGLSPANIIVGNISSAEDAAGSVTTHALADTISFKNGKAVLGDFCHIWCDGTYWFLDGMCKVQDGMTTTQAG